jgi:general secretion pathway protein E
MIAMDLAHILKHRFEVSDEALSEAHHVQSEKGGLLAEILVERQVITEIQMLEALGMRYEIPFWPELPMENIGSDFSKRVSIQFLKRHHIVPMTVPSPTGKAQTA